MSLPKPPVLRITVVQLLLLALLAAALVLMEASAERVVSMAAGAMVAIVPQAYFGYRVFRYTGAQASRQILQSFYRGQAGKFLLTATGFALAFAVLKPVDGAVLFGSFIGMSCIHWAGSWWLTRTRKHG